MNWYEIIKNIYNAGGYPNGIKLFVNVGWITKDEYKQITGQDYDTETETQPA